MSIPMLRVFSYLLAIVGAALLPPLAAALAYGERGCAVPFAVPVTASWAAALAADGRLMRAAPLRWSAARGSLRAFWGRCRFGCLARTRRSPMQFLRA